MKKITVIICTFLFLGILSQAQSLTVTIHIMSNEVCNGGSTGSMSASVSGGTSPYTYSWLPGHQTTSLITGLSAGTYTVSVLDHMGLTGSATATITQPTVLSVSTSQTNEPCYGDNLGSATATPSGGTSPYAYTWSGGGTNATKNALTAGTYTVTVKDHNACTCSTTVTITQPTVLSVSANATANVTCHGGSNGSASATPSGGTSPYTYSWSGGGTNSTKTGLAAGTYTITVDDNHGCQATATVTITQPATLSVIASVTANVSCNGGSNGSVSATPSNGTAPYTYSWSGGGTNSTKTGLAAGTYTITVTDNCSATATATATITQPTTLSVSASAKNSAICPGASDSLFSTPSGGTSPYTYSWTPDPYADMSCATCQKTQCYPYGTTYTMTVTDNNGCTATASISITIHPFPYVTIAGPINPIAPGRSDTLVATAVGATYLWSNSSTNSSIIVSPSVSTTYTVTATNTYGCYDTAHYTIDTNSINNGNSSSSAIPIVPSFSYTTASFSTYDSVVWFSFVAADSNNQIIANSDFLGYPVPHVHRLTLYNSSLTTLVDEPMPDIQGANQIRIDASHLDIGSTYYVRAARTPAHSNMPGCNPNAAGECNPSQRWSFQIAIRTFPVFIPNDSAGESPAMSQLYYEGRGQIADLNDIPRFDIKAYTDNAFPSVFASDSAVSFVYTNTTSTQRVDMELTGSSLQPTQPVFKMEETPGAGFLTYFKEYTFNAVPGINGYSRLVYKNVYPNVDMQVYSNNEGTKLYFICNPAAAGVTAGNPANIELKFNGANSLTVTGSGGLKIATSLGNISFAQGFAYTDSAGVIKPKSWAASFVSVNSTTVKFNTGAYNTNEPLIIEVDRGHNRPLSYPPIGNLDWSTYYGGTNAGNLGAFNAVTHSDSGNVYAIGYTTSLHFPVLHGFSTLDSTYNGDTDAVVVKFNNDYQRKWACYYGGNGADIGRGIGEYTDANNENVFITGSTNSINLPIRHHTGDYFQLKLNGTNTGPNTDVFVALIFDNGLGVQWSTYYGGSGNESGHHLVVDAPTSSFYVVGDGNSNTPLAPKPGAYNSTTGGGLIMQFKYNTSGVCDTEWVTLIGSPKAGLNGCDVNATNHDFFVAGADTVGYPMVNGFNFLGGNYDAAVTKFDGNGVMQWSGYYGGAYTDIANAIVIDPSGNAFVTGHTYSYNLQPGPANAWSYVQDTNGNGPSNHVGGNAFIVEFSGNYPTIQLPFWSTFFGGKGDIDGSAICLDANNNVYITGDELCNTNDSSFVWPSSQPAGSYHQTSLPTGPYETFIAAFNNGGGYYWGTPVCATSANSSAGYGITAFGTQDLYVVGTTSSPPYVFVDPAVTNPWFQDTSNLSTSIACISEFGLTGITTEVNTLKLENGELKVFPNPTTQNVTVQMKSEKEQNVEFILYNLFGEMLYSEKVSEPVGIIHHQISLSNVSSGNYILQVIAGNTIYHAKITKLQ